jgi:hypothetical protein
MCCVSWSLRCQFLIWISYELLNLRIIGNGELERTWRKVTVAYEMAQHPAICLEGLRKTMKALGQVSQPPKQDETQDLTNTKPECWQF